MKNPLNFSYRSVHFIGIGGISVSAIAKLLHHYGIKISGSDISKNENVKELESLGIKVFNKHKKRNITKNIELVVFTGAIKDNNVEYKTAKKKNIPLMERSELLGKISEQYKSVIAVSGTHGKTTTTALIFAIFKEANLNPTLHLGGIDISINSNLFVGDKLFFITEACEYRESFKFIHSNTAIITNIEQDHMDFFKTFDNIKKAFVKFALNSRETLVLFENRSFESAILNSSNKNTMCKIINCGMDSSYNYYPKNILKSDLGYKFIFVDNLRNVSFPIELNVIGFHNIKNCVVAISTALEYNLNIKKIQTAIASFRGVKRRYEFIGRVNNIPVIADYSHHPTEIASSIQGVKEHYLKTCVIFQPHTYSRTADLIGEFVDCFLLADKLLIYKTYSAREKFDKTGSARTLFNKIKNIDKHYCNNKQKIYQTIKNLAGYDCVLILGAGDLYDVIKKFIIEKD